jgi:hypothetical protein
MRMSSKLLLFLFFPAFLLMFGCASGGQNASPLHLPSDFQQYGGEDRAGGLMVSYNYIPSKLPELIPGLSFGYSATVDVASGSNDGFQSMRVAEFFGNTTKSSSTLSSVSNQSTRTRLIGKHNVEQLDAVVVTHDDQGPTMPEHTRIYWINTNGKILYVVIRSGFPDEKIQDYVPEIGLKVEEAISKMN